MAKWVLKPAFFNAWSETGIMGSKRRRRRKKGKKKGEQENRTPSKPVTDAVRAKIEDWSREAAEASGLVLFEVETTGAWLIKVFIELEGGSVPGEGVTIDQCVEVSRYLEAILDAADQVPEKYTVEVSSPGIERPLTREEQLTLVQGRLMRVVTKEPIDGQNVYEGILKRYEDGVLHIEPSREEDEEYRLAWDDVAKAKLIYDF